MTLIEELNAIYDYWKGFRLNVEIVEYDLKSYLPIVLYLGVLTDYGMLNVLDVAHLHLYFMSGKKESCLPLYIVPGSHRIDERVPPY
jgi:hypothetical protein